MSTVVEEKSEVAALNAKLGAARETIKTQDKELNDLRSKVVQLEDASVTDDLEEKLAAAEASLKDVTAQYESLVKQAAKQERDLKAAAPALALVEALNAVK